MTEPNFARNLTTSPIGLAFIRHRESCSLKLYDDEAGHCTIGYGHLVHIGPTDGRAEEEPFKNGITQDQAEQLFRSDVRADGEHFVRIGVEVPISQNQFDALVSFAFNVGGHSFLGSTLLKYLNAGQPDLAADEFPKWDHENHKESKGLHNRREAERAMFLGSDATGQASAASQGGVNG